MSQMFDKSLTKTPVTLNKKDTPKIKMAKNKSINGQNIIRIGLTLNIIIRIINIIISNKCEKIDSNIIDMIKDSFGMFTDFMISAFSSIILIHHQINAG